ncbi:hypothetical protein FEM48_Zijuj10G0090000 [Ziziphus jujuba var. spinosa]|uniref:C-JID domain-containing protein n=1 Tax=Ziziphus jujuba var. spinosa TaxID=714518 RepID=A0A978UMG7_ZIZJJ|nr:hypothetical protein FEM48_Zijuj10G0090000 [Ziziphus jujuba var. spinosa]
MVYPGNVIPQWFDLRARGESFIQLPPNWLNTDDSRFKFVFGAVFAFKISGPETKIRFRFNFTTSMDSSVGGSFNYEDVCTLQVNNSSDHVLIRYATIDLRHVFGVNWSSVCRKVTGASFHVFMEEEKKGNWMIESCGLQAPISDTEYKEIMDFQDHEQEKISLLDCEFAMLNYLCTQKFYFACVCRL